MSRPEPEYITNLAGFINPISTQFENVFQSSKSLIARIFCNGL